MSYFKKFTNFCAGFAAFSALAYVFCKFMEYTPRDQEGELLGIKQKLRHFFDAKEVEEDYRLYLLLVGGLLLSIAIACLLKKIPSVSFATSLLPLSLVATMIADGNIADRPMLYLLLSGLHTAGALYECIRCDREKGSHQAHLAVNLATLLGSLGALFVWRSADKFFPVPNPHYNYLEQKIYDSYLLKEDPSILLNLALPLLVTVLLSMLLREIYFLDAAIALVPLCLILPNYLEGEIPICAEFLLTVVCVNLLARIALMLSLPPQKEKKTSP
ncbi:MAG: hypothetical protein J6Q82_07795 [Clostridia bacterium]|nr:hypothetical protein [Clostridia bacterium]